jgi:hypothetical protein
MTTDFTAHNEEVKQVWDAYEKGHPLRVPFGRFTLTPRIWILDPRLNTQGITWEKFFYDPALMFDTMLKYKYHLVHHVPHDIEMGIPASHWEIGVDFANVTEEAWLGCPVIIPPGQVPATLPRYTGAHKEEIFERGIPDPLSGIFAQVREFYEYFQDRARTTEFYGRPVKINSAPPTYLDGPFTLANGICGPQIMEDMFNDEDYYHRLMQLVTDAEMCKLRAWRAYLGYSPYDPIGGFADDAIQLLSLKTYQEKVFPYHKQILETLFAGVPRTMHLCGNVQRLLPFISQNLNIRSFDTGYPIDFNTLREEVGEEVEIQGGVTVMDLVALSPSEVFTKARDILQSGILRGGRFVMKEANNLAPFTPEENLAAVHAAVKQYGVYS